MEEQNNCAGSLGLQLAEASHFKGPLKENKELSHSVSERRIRIIGEPHLSKIREISSPLLLGRKFMSNLDSTFKSRDITLPTKVRLIKAMVFQWSCMDVRVGL